MSPKFCAVPRCKNTSLSKEKPSKMFAPVPKDPEIRKKWLEAIGKDTKQKDLFICQDHFDLPNDMSNYMMYCVNGSVSRMNIKPSAVPSKFDCLNHDDSKSNTDLRSIHNRLYGKSISHRGTQTDDDLLDVMIHLEEDPLAISEGDYCGSSTFDEGVIKLEKIKTEDDEEHSYYVVL